MKDFPLYIDFAKLIKLKDHHAQIFIVGAPTTFKGDPDAHLLNLTYIYLFNYSKRNSTICSQMLIFVISALLYSYFIMY